MADPADEPEGSRRNIILGYAKVEALSDAMQAVRLMVGDAMARFESLTQIVKGNTQDIERAETRIRALEDKLLVMESSRKNISHLFATSTAILGVVFGAVAAYAAIKGLKP